LKRCESSRRHKAPFFSVSILTREVGRGSRLPGYRRAAQKTFVTTLCGDCLKVGRIEADGKDLVPA